MSTIKSPLQTWVTTVPVRDEDLTGSLRKATEAAVELATKEWARDKTDEELEIVFSESAEETKQRLGLG